MESQLTPPDPTRKGIAFSDEGDRSVIGCIVSCTPEWAFKIGGENGRGWSLSVRRPSRADDTQKVHRTIVAQRSNFPAIFPQKILPIIVINGIFIPF
tara:strand:+ start:1024 stop:1314 length:291 start_codon:yes stop_codon:yes gene_type:complete